MSSTIPLVTIWCPVYNHEKYITQTIEGFLLQKVNFPIEIIIHDDASTDGTAKIIRAYELKFPNLILPVYQKENQFSKNTAHLTQLCLQISRGKYIALCEGDDYWTDPYKLQKQLDFLEKNPDFSSCFHSVLVLKDGKLQKDDMIEVNEATTINDLAKYNYIRTCSYMFRNNLIKELPSNYQEVNAKDYFTVMLIAKHGKIKKFRESMCVYRKHEGGIWSPNDSITKFKSMLKDFELLFLYFEDDVRDILKERHAEIIFRFASFIVTRKIVDNSKEYLHKSIGVNMDAFLRKITNMVHENNLLKEKKKSLKSNLKNVFNLTKNKLSR